MPELPEVESIRLELNDKLLSSKITRVKFSGASNLLDKNSLPLSQIKSKKLNSISRLGKYLTFDFDEYQLLAHLGMSGVFLVNEMPYKHTHLQLGLDNNSSLIYNDPRRFGYLNLQKQGFEFERLKKLGPDAISQAFTAKYLKNKISKTTKDIKTTLLNQSVVAGIGNIYASEILFQAKVSPLRSANELNDDELKLVVKFTKSILKKSIANRGTTFSDYRLTDGKSGDFQNCLKVFHKDEEECSICKTEIVKIAQNGRSTFYCPNCQR